jgi:hypothetical protein
MASKHVTLTIPEEVVAYMVNVHNKSAMVTRLLCAHYNLNPDTLKPIVDEFIPIDYVKRVTDFVHIDKLENDEHGV